MKILVVDDDQVTGMLLKKRLTKQGDDVTYVRNGAEATNAIEK